MCQFDVTRNKQFCDQNLHELCLLIKHTRNEILLHYYAKISRPRASRNDLPGWSDPDIVLVTSTKNYV